MIKRSSSLSIVLTVVIIQYLFETCDAKCSSSCGIISNITSPFRLKGDSNNCGDRRFVLSCKDNITSISLNSQKYYVKAINYLNSTMRLVDASINTSDICSFPHFSAYAYNFTYKFRNSYPYRVPENSSYPLHFMRCPLPLRSSSSLILTDITADCAFNGGGYAYIKVGPMKVSELSETMCSVDLIVMTSWKFKDLSSVSLSEIHDSLLYGFELTITPSSNLSRFEVFFYSLIPILLVIVGLLCAVVSPPVFTIFGFVALSLLLFITVSRVPYVHYFNDKYSLPAFILGIMICAPRIMIFPLAMWLLIYKFRTRHFSIFDAIESFLQSDNKLVPIRYSYSDIKKMTRGFQDKIGEGGYGCVYKGKLRSRHHVAVKLLRNSKANVQDFMNEIATIGRIHHVNVVKLVGYCSQGSNHALVFDFMPNGSLEKYLFNPEKINALNWDLKFEIAVGIARGIEYLHRGCDIQILHFDIKPHNILLDHNFVPKISDFGLAKFYSTDKKTVTMTMARGTIGYVAPELISRSIGAVSYKADVYSFGMLMMEIVGLNKDLKGSKGDSGLCFPYWIYDIYKQGKDIEIGEANENGDDYDNEGTRILCRKMTIVALWCIQMRPDDRPSMNKVLQMLEGNVEHLEIPEYLVESNQSVMNADESGTTCFTHSGSWLLHPDDSLLNVEITVLTATIRDGVAVLQTCKL